jgi:carbonic anhydrase/acetyltransferase-like protein (isoleucine patch superfamily)
MTSSSLSSHHGCAPQLASGAWVHPRATVIGEVSLAEAVSVWPGAVLRGDVNRIVVGRASNVQDNAVLHVSHKTAANPGGAPLLIGERVTIGHGVILHGCTLGDECLIGMGSIILDGAVLEPQVLLGAGSLVSEGKRLIAGNLYLGRPARLVRPLTETERAYFAYSAGHYVKLALSYAEPS